MTSNEIPPQQGAGAGSGKTLPGANSALILLLAINLFNFMDRMILSSVEPEIRRELLQGVDDAEFWSGLLATAFLVTYMVIAPVFGVLADRMSRWVIVAMGVIIWSLASGASGLDWVTLFGVNLAVAYWLMVATRCLVGFGEGAYGPVAPTMLADLFPVEKRGKVMSLFYLAIPVGGALGFTLGGAMKGLSEDGWRWAFYAVVPPGILLGFICFFMKEPARGMSETVKKPVSPPQENPEPDPKPEQAQKTLIDGPTGEIIGIWPGFLPTS